MNQTEESQPRVPPQELKPLPVRTELLFSLGYLTFLPLLGFRFSKAKKLWKKLHSQQPQCLKGVPIRFLFRVEKNLFSASRFCSCHFECFILPFSLFLRISFLCSLDFSLRSTSRFSAMKLEPNSLATQLHLKLELQERSFVLLEVWWCVLRIDVVRFFCRSFECSCCQRSTFWLKWYIPLSFFIFLLLLFLCGKNVPLMWFVPNFKAWLLKVKSHGIKRCAKINCLRSQAEHQRRNRLQTWSSGNINHRHLHFFAVHHSLVFKQLPCVLVNSPLSGWEKFNPYSFVPTPSFRACWGAETSLNWSTWRTKIRM